jgi:hypothetical protein
MKMNRVKCSDIHQYTINNSDDPTNITNNESINTESQTNKGTVAQNIFGEILNAENNYIERLNNPIIKTNRIKCTEFESLSDVSCFDNKVEQQENTNETDNTISKIKEIKKTDDLTEIPRNKISINVSGKTIVNEVLEDIPTETIEDHISKNTKKNEVDSEKDNIQTCNITIKASPFILELLNNITIKKTPEENTVFGGNTDTENEKTINISSLKNSPLANILKGLINITNATNTCDQESSMIEIYSDESKDNDNIKNSEEENVISNKREDLSE